MIRTISWCLLLAVVSQCAAAQPDEFRFHKDIQRRDAGAENLLEVALDADVYAATRDAFPDLRVFDAVGNETPFLLTETLAERDTKVDYPVALSRIEEDPAEKATIVYVDARREPLTELTLETSSRNFSRAVAVQVSTTHGVHARWTDLAHGQVSLLDFGQVHRKALSVSFPEQRQSEYRIVIRNEDSPPLRITGVKSRGNQYRAIFLAAENQSYRLDYGSHEVEPPKYDAAAVLAPLRLRDDRPSDGVLGMQIANAAGKPEAVSSRRLLNNPLFMGAVIAMLVAVLAWALFRATRRINEIPKE